MKKGFTLIELMILVMVIGILAMAIYPSYNSIQKRALEALVVANMHTAQIAVEDFATLTDGLYPQFFNITVNVTNSHMSDNTTVAGVAGGLLPVASTQANPVLLPGNFRNPISRTVGWAFASSPASQPHIPPAIVIPAVGGPADQGSIIYYSADINGNAASIGNAKQYTIFGCGVSAVFPRPLTAKQ